MTDTIEFGKRINHRPLIVSFIGGFFVGGLELTANIKVAIISFLAVLFLLLCIYFSANLPKIFGHWQLENHGISYYKMNSYWDKLKIILFPNRTEFQFISYSQIKGFKVIEREKEYDLNNLLTINPAKQSFLPFLRKPFFLRLEINQDKIDLDLSYNQFHDSKNTLFRLSNVLKKLAEKIN